MKLIVGLGNPGREYENTRHNLGFKVLDYLSKKFEFSFENKKFDGIYSIVILNNKKVMFLKPQTYMNLSGEVIKKFIDYYQIPTDDILIIYDDMDLEVGKYKLKQQGGTAGHNGLKNIEKILKTNKYKRIKIGIAKNKSTDVVNYVLGKLSLEEEEKINIIIEKIPYIINDYLNESFEMLMTKYN